MSTRSVQRSTTPRISRKLRLNRSGGRPVSISRHYLGLQRGISKPSEATPETIVALQRTYGNRAVQRLTESRSAEGGTLDGRMSQTIERSQGGGQPLTAGVRSPMEQAFQSDFSNVRVHTDAQADSFNHAVQAQAFTLGQDIYFGKDNYAPGTPSGKKLLAHELTHVVQQTGPAASALQRKPEDKPSYAANSAAYFDVANQITSIMEGGSTKGSYSALTTINDGGIISYGKHQATLSSGSLGSILNAYIASSQSANAEVIRKNITRINQKDVTLKDDKNFLDALRGAAGEKEMQVAQDLIFSQGYWNPAVKAAQNNSVQSPLGFAMLYDTKIQGGMESCMTKAQTKCGGKIGEKVGDKTVTEIDFLKAFNDAREERLEAIAVAAEAKGETTKANAVRGSKYRCRAFRKLLEAGNLNVAGPEGTVEVLGPGGKAYKIEGFDAQASGTPTAPQTSAAQDTPGTSPAPTTNPTGPAATAMTGVAKVTADALNVRQGPDASTTKLGTLTRGTQANVTGREGDWFRIAYKGKPAYIHSKYVEFMPAPPEAKPNFLDQTIQAGKSFLNQALDAGKGLVNWATSLFSPGATPAAQPNPPQAAQPQQKQQNTSIYESQRDNKYDKVDDNGQRIYGGVMCNVTTLAMQLQTLAGGREKAVRAAVNLLIKNDPELAGKAAVLCGAQLEDLLMQRFDQISAGKPGWKKALGGAYEACAKLHDTGVAGKGGKLIKYAWNEQADCLRYVGGEFTEFVSMEKDKKPRTNWLGEKGAQEPYYRNILQPMMEKDKATVMISTELTGGHIVLLSKVIDNGILIHDPYGALLDRQSNYIKNGTDKADAANRLKQSGEQVIKERLKFNVGAFKTLQTLVSPEDKTGAKVPQNIGELNFYTWDETKKYNMGKWNNILFKA